MTRKIILAGMVVVALGAVALWFGNAATVRRLRLQTYFADAQGLRVGAPIRIAGVDVGTVTEVRANPERRNQPAEVTLDLRTSYDLKVPVDAIVSLSTIGVLGDTYANIDVSSATGPLASDGAVLKSRESQKMDTKEFLEKVQGILQSRSCEEKQPVGTGGKK